ncbi:YbfB/YjiJ family MFS transporter [Nonomuraea sp. NPDC026600]|uniref:YbfB/YjiJ family MFS transporter n=1 Tax=Nonomuraea sp. NPDC026600 TaxID=3155363 RepID=UPI0033CC5326
MDSVVADPVGEGVDGGQGGRRCPGGGRRWCRRRWRPPSALWAWSARRWSRPDLLCAALVIQTVGIALPALIGGVAAALISAFLFGATFLGAATIVLAVLRIGFPHHLATSERAAVMASSLVAGVR